MAMYIVRGVASADTLLVCKPEDKDKSLEAIKIGISSIRAPKVGRSTKADGVIPDDAWGWEAREFVRKAVIGKTIKFNKEQHVEQLRRDIGEVFFQKDGKTANLGVELARQGLASINERAASKASAYTSAIAEAEMEAVTEKRGKYGGGSSRTGVTWECDDETVEGLGKLRGKKVEAVIEAVIGGDRIKVLLLPAQVYVMVSLTGIMCESRERPGEKISDKDKEALVRAYDDAKAFTDRMLNNRDVTLIIEGVRPAGPNSGATLLASVVQGDQSFQSQLLKRGLAKVFDQTMTKATHRDALRAAEEAAKTAKVGRWVNLVQVQKVAGGAGGEGGAAKVELAKTGDFTGILFEIKSPDTVIVFNPATKQEVKVSLANVRGGGSSDNEPPKRAADGEDGPRGGYAAGPSHFAKIERLVDQDMVVYNNFFMEGRDLISKAALGKEVKVSVDYMSRRPLGPPRGEAKEQDFETQCNASVYVGEKNIGVELIKAGFGVPIHSKDGSARDFDAYADAFEEAKSHKRGIHGNRSKGIHKVQDMQSGKPGQALNANAEKKGQSMKAYLQRSGSGMAGIPKLPAFVEYVLGPARLKLYIPRENVCLSLNMAGIAAPSLPMPNSKDEPDSCGAEALFFTRKNLLQRTIEVQVEHFHKGTFVGNVFIDGQNFATKLLSEGLATMEGQNTASMSGKGSSMDAEKQAKKEQKGMWAPGNSLPRRVIENVERFEKKFAGRATFQVGTGAREAGLITEVLDGSTFYYQDVAAQQRMDKVNSLLHGLNLDSLPPAAELVRDAVV